jgi:uncharacterized protein YgbK (DUF1537 family)
MISTLIIADDSTGANASAILLNQAGYQSLSIIDYQDICSMEGYDVVAISTDSRAVSKNLAYQRVYDVCNKFKNQKVLVINKRVDSTLRGNLGAELNAFKDVFPRKKIAIVPAFPNSKRYCLDGKIYVGNTLLEFTDVAKDPKMPIFTSEAVTLFKKQFLGSIAHVSLDDIHNGELYSKIISLYDNYDAILFDAKTNEDIMLISKEIAKLKIDLITVDPGPFTYYYTNELQKNVKHKEHRYYYLIGSVTDTTFEQLKYAKNDSKFDFYFIDPELLLNDDASESAILKTLSSVKKSKKRFIMISTTDPEDRKILNLNEIAKLSSSNVDDISKKINNKLALLLSLVLDQDRHVKGVFTTGGDVTLSFLKENHAKAISLKKEVFPLCVYGKVVEGKYDGLNIITKGGMIGSEDAYIKIKNYIEENLFT